MTDNPYASPASEIEAAKPQRKLRTLSETALVGCIVGGSIGSLAAPLMGLPIGIIYDLLDMDIKDIPDTFFFLTLGLWPFWGVLVGPGLAVVACKSLTQYHKRLTLHCALAFAVPIVLCYLGAGLYIGVASSSSTPKDMLIIVLQLGIAALCGMVCGAIIGDSLGKFLWGPPPPKDVPKD